jgi:hypothetical protein
MNEWYYVATVSRYVLVRANSPEQARDLGQAELPTPVRTVRPATGGEIGLMAWHHERARDEQSLQVRRAGCKLPAFDM